MPVTRTMPGMSARRGTSATASAIPASPARITGGFTSSVIEVASAPGSSARSSPRSREATVSLVACCE